MKQLKDKEEKITKKYQQDISEEKGKQLKKMSQKEREVEDKMSK